MDKQPEQPRPGDIGISVPGTLNAPGAQIVGIAHGDAILGQHSGVSGDQLAQVLAPLMKVVEEAPPEKRAEARQQAEDLKEELAKGKDASDDRIARIVDGLVGMVPGAVSAIVSMFASPILGGLVGPVTKFVLDRIQGK